MLRQGLSTDTQAHIHSASCWVAEKAHTGRTPQTLICISLALSVKMLSDHLLASVNSALKKISITIQPDPW